MKDIKISIIVPTYNRSLLLKYTLDSIKNQQIEKDFFEVVIADDGSSDDTKDVVNKYSSLLNIKYIFQNDEGYRPASARNKGILQASGDICLFIDSGVLLHSDCINQHLKFHLCNNNNCKSVIGYVYGFDHDEPSEDTIRKAIDLENIDLSIVNFVKSQSLLDVRDIQFKRYNYNIQFLPAPWFYFWTCHVSVRTSELLRIGLFDEKYDGRWGAEDLDLGFRLNVNNHELILLTAAQAIHYPHNKNKKERKNEGYENTKYFHQKFNSLSTYLFLKNYFRNDNKFGDLNKEILYYNSLNTNTIISEIQKKVFYD